MDNYSIATSNRTKPRPVNVPIGRLADAGRIQEINEPTVPIKRHIHHVAVQDADIAPHREEPLSAYMVPPQYLPRDVIARTAPKRPLGNPAAMAAPAPRQPVNFHLQAQALSEPMRIRRSRKNSAAATPVATDTDRQSSDQNIRHGMWGAGIFAALAGGVMAAKSSIGRLFSGKHRVRYDANSGTRSKHTSPTNKRVQFGAAILIFLLLLSFGLFSGLVDDFKQSPNTSDGTKNGASSGNSVLDVSDNPNADTTGNNQNGTTKGGSTTNPQPSTVSPGTPNPAGTSLQPSQSSVPPTNGQAVVGGRGGTDPSVPVVGTGSNTIPEALPTPPAADPLLQNTPSTPLPITVTVPPQNISTGGKTVVDTDGTTITLN